MSILTTLENNLEFEMFYKINYFFFQKDNIEISRLLQQLTKNNRTTKASKCSSTSASSTATAATTATTVVGSRVKHRLTSTYINAK